MKDVNLATLNKAITRSLRACCDQNLLASVGAVPNCVDFCVMLANIMGRDNKAILLEVHASLVAPIRVPQMGKGCTQPQDMLLYMMAAFEARMNIAELLNANSASLAYLKLLESMPVGTGDMGPPVAEIKAIWEENLMTGACTTREAVTASIKDTLNSLGGKRWNGDLVQDQAYKLKNAYALEAEPESASAPQPKSEAGQAPEGSSGARKPECTYWASKRGCRYPADACRNGVHPNGLKFKERRCANSGRRLRKAAHRPAVS